MSYESLKFIKRILLCSQKQQTGKFIKYFLFVTLFIFTFFLFIRTNFSDSHIRFNSPNNNISREFLVGAIDGGADTSFSYIADSLGFNLWHRYCSFQNIEGKKYPLGWEYNGAVDDKLFADLSTYSLQVQRVLTNIDNHNMKALLTRPKIEYLCYGQRSDYQCEESNIPENYWFYAFNSHEVSKEYTSDFQDNTIFGENQWVKYCRGNQANAQSAQGFVVRRLKANNEQCFRSNEFDAYRWDSQSDWYIKPRIRIEKDYANNKVNWENIVCKIIILGQSGYDTLKTVNIKVKNFLDNSLNYDGKYLEEYNHFENKDTLIIHGDWVGTDMNGWWMYGARGNAANDTGKNKADIQIYWFGLCDMWLDYVRVDNDIAHNLFSKDPENSKHSDFMNWLQWESELANFSNSPLQYYIELFQFNQIPCIAYVNSILDSISSLSKRHLNVMADQFTFYQYHMPDSAKGTIVSAEKIRDMYINKTGTLQIFTGNPYPFTAAHNGNSQFSIIPNTLPRTSGGQDFLPLPAMPENYDAWLQGLFDTTCTWFNGGSFDESNHSPYMLPGLFMYTMKQGNAVSKLCNIPFIALLQAHQVYNQYEVEREPTAEEIDVMSNIAVSFGAKGILYYNLPSWNGDSNNYNYGILDPGLVPRYNNLYGQPKWERLKQTVNRLKKWGPTLMSFDNCYTNSYIYRIEKERNNFLNNSFFDIINAYPPSGNSLNVRSNIADSSNSTYLQTATFKNDELNSYYFMIVNRRCSPYREDINENGGRRYIRIKFDKDAGEFSLFHKWKIIDISDNSVVKIFIKNTRGYIDLKWFMPGEGKLYKIIPAIQSEKSLSSKDFNFSPYK